MVSEIRRYLTNAILINCSGLRVTLGLPHIVDFALPFPLFIVDSALPLQSPYLRLTPNKHKQSSI